jgi:hypothetical protein
MILSALAFAIIAGLFFLPKACFPQWIDQIQTESDWEELYRQGYFDYSSYQIYRELAEGAEVVDTTEYLKAAQGSPILEITRGALSGVKPEFEGDSIEEFRRLFFRAGRRIYDGDNSGYFMISHQRDSLAMLYKARDDGNHWSTERRSLNLGLAGGTLTLGNFANNIGLGLAIGRFDYRPRGGAADTAAYTDDFFYPDNSLFNGLKINLGQSQAILSSKKYPGLIKDMAGIASAIRAGENIIGAAFAGTRLRAGGYSRTMGVASVFFERPDLESEIAYGESGIGAAARLFRSRYNLTLWHYEDSFLNLQCSGPASHDYTLFFNPHFNETFRQTQSGESGFLLQGVLLDRGALVTAATETWKRADTARVSSDNSVTTRFAPYDNVILSARLGERFGGVGRRLLSEVYTEVRRPLEFSVKVSVWSERGKAINEKSFCHAFMRYPILANARLGGRIRFHFDGAFDFFVEEEAFIGEKLRLKATYRWRDSYDDAGPLYIVMESIL